MGRKINDSYVLAKTDLSNLTGGETLKVEWDTVNNGNLHWKDVDESSLEYVAPAWYGGRGVFGGGSYNVTMEYITISTTSNTTDFGDLNYGSPSYNVEGSCNGTRGIFQGGHSSATNVLDYITVASTGNAISFGALSVDRYNPGSLGDATRAVFGGGDTGGATKVNTMDYVSYDTTGNATDFGNLTVSRNQCSGASDTTRGIFAGGNAGPMDVMDYITIQTTGNATDFGNQSVARYGSGACSSSVRGVWAGGCCGYRNTIDYVTIQTTGNATDFGDLLGTQGFGAGLAGD